MSTYVVPFERPPFIPLSTFAVAQTLLCVVAGAGSVHHTFEVHEDADATSCSDGASNMCPPKAPKRHFKVETKVKRCSAAIRYITLQYCKGILRLLSMHCDDDETAGGLREVHERERAIIIQNSLPRPSRVRPRKPLPRMRRVNY